NAFEHDREGTRVLEREGVVDETSRGTRGLRLHLEAAELRYALRREADVRHNGDPVRGEGAHRLDDLGAALDLDRIHARFFEEPGSVVQRLGRTRLVRAERHIADE